MYQRFFLILGLVVNFPIGAKAHQDFVLHKDLRVSLRGWSLIDGKDESLGTEVQGDLSGKWLWKDLLQFNFSFIGKASSSRVQESFGIYKPAQGVFLKDANLEYGWGSGGLRLGAIDQGRWGHPIVMASLPSLGWAAFQSLPGLVLHAGWGIPPSYSSNFQRVDVEGSSSFSIVMAEASYERGRHNLEASWAYFLYEDLPSVVIKESHLRGNTGLIGSPSSYLFPYGFQGNSYKLGFCSHLGWEFCLKSNWVENTKAESVNRGRAQVVSFELQNKGSSLELSHFVTGSQVAPALYSSPKYAYVGRRGQSVTFVQNLHTQLDLFIGYTFGTSSVGRNHPKFRSLQGTLSFRLLPP